MSISMTFQYISQKIDCPWFILIIYLLYLCLILYIVLVSLVVCCIRNLWVCMLQRSLKFQGFSKWNCNWSCFAPFWKFFKMGLNKIGFFFGRVLSFLSASCGKMADLVWRVCDFHETIQIWLLNAYSFFIGMIQCMLYTGLRLCRSHRNNHWIFMTTCMRLEGM